MMVDGSINDRMNPCNEGDHPLVCPSIAPSSFAPILSLEVSLGVMSGADDARSVSRAVLLLKRNRQRIGLSDADGSTA